MNRIEQETEELKKEYPDCTVTALSTGGHLVEVRKFPMPPGWNISVGTILFLAPPGYPFAQPDCFWVEPKPVRLANGATPQNSNDVNLIPGVAEQRGTWFSWHLSAWDPNHDSFRRFVRVILQRLKPAR
jgi:Prokaryotic E2 family E